MEFMKVKTEDQLIFKPNCDWGLLYNKKQADNHDFFKKNMLKWFIGYGTTS